MRHSLLLIIVLATPPTAWAQAPSPQLPMQAPSAIPAMAAPATPQLLTIQLVPSPTPAAGPAYAPAPAMAMPSMQAPQAAPFVNPFVVQQPAQPVPQQSIATVATTGLILLADNPWIVDRILGAIGEWLAKRGHPRITLAPPNPAPASAAQAIPITLVATQPAAAPSFATVAMPSPQGGGQGQGQLALPVTQARPHRTRLGRWFFGE